MHANNYGLQNLRVSYIPLSKYDGAICDHQAFCELYIDTKERLHTDDTDQDLKLIFIINKSSVSQNEPF